ncbi:MAG TPA: hypothetical protein VMT16_17030 [Thermoanaerobaculia bacterium]|nr:hypothetical protein [Thermoanaerobaculia bacterium]
MRRRHREGAGAAAVGMLLLALLAPPQDAQAAPPVAIGVQAGSAGLGVDLALRPHQSLQPRLAVRGWTLDDSFEETGITYDAELQLASALLLLDWYPTGAGFRISVGAGWNGTELELTAPLEQLLRREVPDLPPIDVDVGRAVGTAAGDDLVPALLLGWGSPFAGGRWGASFEVGAVYHGRPEVELRAETPLPIGSIPGGAEALAALIADERRALEAELEDYRVLPVVSFGVWYRW